MTGCLCPTKARMLAPARTKGFDDALVADAFGNLAESATANVFFIKDGTVFTPVSNRPFLAGITPVTAFDDMRYQVGPVTRRARDLYRQRDKAAA